jgi:hypothetical protein
VRLINAPVSWSARGLDRALNTVRATPPTLGQLLSRGAHARDVAAKTVTATHDAPVETTYRVTHQQGAEGAGGALRSVPTGTSTGVPESGELPIEDFDELILSQAVAAVQELTDPTDVRAVVAYEEAHKNRNWVVSAGQTRLAAIARQAPGLR